jgi:hypothetical protein
MNYVEAPARPPFVELPTVFLAGGITGVRDWQTDMARLLADFDKGTLFNPRRANYSDSEEVAREQITWEFFALWQAPIITFWFSKETLCPITLFELGVHLARSRLAKNNPPKICIGIEPGYTRELDIRTQARLLAPETPIVSSLEELAHFIRETVPAYA